MHKRDHARGNERGLFGRFGHDSIAGNKRRRDLPDKYCQWKIPR